MRIAILDNNNRRIGTIDNSAPDALHYYDDVLHTYLKGSNFTFEFKTYSDHEDSRFLVVGNHLSFIYDNKPYYCNIVSADQNEYTMSIMCYGLVFEMLNETLGSYASESKTFVGHLSSFGIANNFYRIGVNEIPNLSRSVNMDSEQTVLARIYSLASEFDAEVEFITELNSDYSLKDVVINIYHKHDELHQGMGANRTETIIRYGQEIKGVSKSTDITELVTAIKPIGENNITIAKEEYYERDGNGKLLFSSPKGDERIYAHAAMEQFPSNLLSSDRYISGIFSVNSNKSDVVFTEGLERLKAYCQPKVSYTVTGYIDADIGDTVTIEDNAYDPILYIEARVTEQEISTTRAGQNKTTFDNFYELESQVSLSLAEEIKRLLATNREIITNIVNETIEIDKLQIQWGEGLKTSTNEGKIGMRALVTYPDENTAQVVVEVWFWSQSLISDKNNSFYFRDNSTTVGTTATKTGLPIVTTEKDWSEKNKLLIYTKTLTFDTSGVGTGNTTRNCAARLKGIDVLGGSSGYMNVTIQYTY